MFDLQAVREIRECLKTELCDSFRVTVIVLKVALLAWGCISVYPKVVVTLSVYVVLSNIPQGVSKWYQCFILAQEEPKLHVKVQPIKSISFIITKKSSSSFLEILTCCLGRHIVILFLSHNYEHQHTYVSAKSPSFPFLLSSLMFVAVGFFPLELVLL